MTEEAGIPRLASASTDPNDPSFLHYRSLFRDLEKAAACAQGKLLDLGCGNKPYIDMFRRRVTNHIGCDVVQSSELRVDVLCSVTELPFKDGSYDTVLCTQVIEHVADHRALLREAFRVLRPGGVIIVSGPMYWPIHGEPNDFFRFTEYGFRFVLENAGFCRVEVLNNGGKWALCGQVLVHIVISTRLRQYPFLIRGINRLFAFLEDRTPTRDNPMNYVVIGRKPKPADRSDEA